MTQHQRIIEILKTGPKSISEIQEATDIERGAVRGRLSELRSRGAVVKKQDKFQIVQEVFQK